MIEVLISLLKVLSVLCIFYGSIVLLLIGPFRVFSFFYLALGIFLFLLSFFRQRIEALLTKRVFSILLYVLCALFIVFVIVEAKIVSYSLKAPEKDADYLIVLGSQIKESGPSMDFKARLDSAFDYLLENKDTIVITTGGKGENEPIAEAVGGADYLIEKGIEKERIRIEDRSSTTLENLLNAKTIIEKEDSISRAKVVIVSADYHLYRASYIADKIGMKNVSCKGGHGLAVLLPHYYTREFFALIKEVLFFLK